MELATVNEENPCGNRGFHLLCQPLALEQAELTEVMTAWPLLSADLRVAILAIVRSVAEEVVAKTP